MNVSGTATMHAPAGQVWAALTDAAVLARTIPGCERLEPAGPGSCRFTIAADVASLHGTYAGEATLSQLRQPVSFVLAAHGAGGPGTVTATVQVTLSPGADGTTELSYDADAAIGGMIAGVGQRMVAGVARRLAGNFLGSVDQILARNGAVPAHPAPPARPAARPAARAGAATTGSGFLRGVLVGAAVTTAGVVVARLISRRAR